MQQDPETSDVVLIEVGTRDGFQNERKFIPTSLKVQIIERLIAAGISQIQVASFVNPDLVPQMADADEVCRRLNFQKGVTYSGLALNQRGVMRAALAGLNAVDVSISTTDTHSRKNAGCSLVDARKRLKKMIRTAKAESLEVRAGFSNIWGCAYEGVVPMSRILDMVKEAIDYGADYISLADSTGMANPKTTIQTINAITEVSKNVPLILHSHDTRGLGLANIYASLSLGIKHFDTSLAGMGGCPYIPGAAGNVATEDVANLMTGLGIQTGIDVLSVAHCSLHLERHLGKTFPGKLHRLMERKVNS